MNAGRKLVFLLVFLALAGTAFAEAGIIPVSRTEPAYPPAAAQSRIQGSATVVLTVADSGKVADASVESEYPAGQGFGAAAREAALIWTFKPGAAGRYTVTMNFLLDPAETDPVEGATGLPRAPKPLKAGKLSYPAAAGVRNQNGSVVLIITIEADGTVSAADVFSERPRQRGFGRSARQALLASLFPPGIEGRYAVPVHFGIYSDEVLDGKTRTRSMAYAPEPLTRVAPDYPAGAMSKKIEGNVTLAILITEEGKVENADIIIETPMGEEFGHNARRAVKEWTFLRATNRPSTASKYSSAQSDSLAACRLRRASAVAI